MPRSALTSNCRALPARPQTEISDELKVSGTFSSNWLRAARKEASSRRRLAAASEAAMPRTARLASSAIESLESRRLLSASWYVASWGNNLAAGSLSAPFQSIEKAAEVAQPGDTVYVRGGTYHETIRPWSSGTRAAPITFEPYNNESVTIDGADPVAGWDGSGAPIFTTQLPWSMGSGNNQIFVDGQPMTEARWPNTNLDLSHPTFATVASASAHSGYDTATIYDPSMTQSPGFWNGGLIHIQAGQGWVAQTGTIVDSRPGQVTFTYLNNGSYETPQAGNHYYLTGGAGALDIAGEWSLSASGQLSLWTLAGDSPANHVVEAKHRQYAFDLSGLSNIEIDGFNIVAATINTDTHSTNDVINGITAKYLSQYDSIPNGWAWQMQSGIVLRGANDVLENSEIAFSPGDGVLVSGPGSVVNNNVIHDVDYLGTDAAGVQITGAGTTVENNTIYNTGRDGILIQGGQSTVTHNLVHDFGLQTTDVGGIYTVATNGLGSEISYNQVYNGSTGGYGSVGIYLDNNSANFIVDHNVTWNVMAGMRLNFTSRNEQVYNNTLDGYQNSVDKNWGAYDWSGTVFRNNIFTDATSFGQHATVQNNWGGDPGFVNAAGHNYALLPGSAAIDAGMKLGPYTAGYVGAGPDLGALEHGVSVFGVGAVPVSKTISSTPTSPVPVGSSPQGSKSTSGSSSSSSSGSSSSSSSKTPTPPTPSSISATGGINPFALAGQTGPAKESYGGLGYLYPGNWIEYSSINFGSGVKSVTLQIAVGPRCGYQKIEFRVDGLEGKVIGSLITRPTGSWSTYTIQTAAISGASGIHNLYLDFIGTPGFGMGNIKAIKFA